MDMNTVISMCNIFCEFNMFLLLWIFKVFVVICFGA